MFAASIAAAPSSEARSFSTAARLRDGCCVELGFVALALSQQIVAKDLTRFREELRSRRHLLRHRYTHAHRLRTLAWEHEDGLWHGSREIVVSHRGTTSAQAADGTWRNAP
jgi:hypothetical protein